jgi:hypothetical protein
MSNKTFKKPDLKAPRFRKEVYNILNPEFFKSFKTKYPKYSNVSDADIKKIIKKFNVLFWETVIDKRDGVQFPEGLGYLFIGTCQTSKKSNVDFGKSNKYGVTVTNNNWGTDGKLAKIFYTNYASKYKFTNRECWAFIGCRNFKRTVARTYPENWTIYVQVDPMKKIRKIFQSTVLKSMTKKIEDRKLENYNEFDL